MNNIRIPFGIPKDDFFFFSSVAMDSNCQSNYKLNKTEKKFLRKQIKARHTLLRHEGIETVSYATQVT